MHIYFNIRMIFLQYTHAALLSQDNSLDFYIQNIHICIWLEKRAETISARARLILFIFLVQFLYLKCEMSGHYDRMPLDHLEKKLPAKWKALWYTVSHNLYTPDPTGGSRAGEFFFLCAVACSLTENMMQFGGTNEASFRQREALQVALRLQAPRVTRRKFKQIFAAVSTNFIKFAEVLSSVLQFFQENGQSY